MVAADNGASWGDLLQFTGALVGALVAVGLWVAERRREHKKSLRVEAEALRDFRSVIMYAVDDVLKQANYMDLSLKQFVSDYENIRNLKSEGRFSIEAAFLSKVKSKTAEFPIAVPSVLGFSVEHARYLRPSENAALAEVITEIRSVNSQVWDLSTSDSVQAVGDRLDVVASGANLLYAKVEKFRASLEEANVVAAGGRVQRGL